MEYSHGDSWDHMLQQGIQLLECFAQDQRVRVPRPHHNLQFKFTRPLVIEQAIGTAALMLGSDKARGYCLEMIRADFLAGAHLEGGNPKILLLSMMRLFRLLPATLRQEFLQQVSEAA